MHSLLKANREKTAWLMVSGCTGRDGSEVWWGRRRLIQTAGCSFWRRVRVGSQAALPHLGDAVIIVAGLSEQTGALETDTALVAGWGVRNTCTTLTSNMFPKLASWWQVNDRNDQWHHIKTWLRSTKDIWVTPLIKQTGWWLKALTDWLLALF